MKWVGLAGTAPLYIVAVVFLMVVGLAFHFVKMNEVAVPVLVLGFTIQFLGALLSGALAHRTARGHRS